MARHVAALAERRRALLIVNSKSGPKADSLLRTREIAEKLALAGIQVDVKVKIKKKRARRDAKRAAKRGYPLVIAAGGDGTVEAVASGLIGTQAVLGILPLGTYNNVATCLGIPTDLDQAVALIASGATRPIDVGRVIARGMKKPKLFIEMAGVGLGAALMPVGQDVEKGRWETGAEALPVAMNMSPTETLLRLNGSKSPARTRTLLVELINAPRHGAGIVTLPEARMDDGLLDVQVYRDMDQPAIAKRFLALKMGTPTDDASVERWQAMRVEVQTAEALPVVADSKVVGSTPARFDALPGALLVIAGDGMGLTRPASAALVSATVERAAPLLAVAYEKPEDPDELPPKPPAGEPDHPVLARVAEAVAPLAARTVKASQEVRKAPVPVTAAAVGAAGLAAVPLLRVLFKRFGL
ncbi:MAG TPA: YegS/Rv2252/BmrU family lipid kinase [Chloroflexota bacterium]|nr:YegS/Rv2252/BmrU family lipid kinase [Chloroflexota bacterium]